MKRTKINNLLKLAQSPGDVLVKGWVRTKRDSKEFSFMEINDGSCLSNIQAIADKGLANYAEIGTLTTGSSVSVSGTLVESPGKGQKWEIKAKEIEIINLAPDSYPLQKKRHSDEFLRTIAHLRPRTNKFGAAFRLRSEMAYAVHKFYKEKGFRYLTTPLITGSDCEGAGEMFRVTSLDPETVQKMGKMDFSLDFFGRESNLTVSGQLSAEMFALALGDVYTFGPTFRAENSNTSRHVAEFWMLEPEMAFCDLNGNMDHGEELVKYLTRHAVEECAEDLSLFQNFVDKTLTERLDTLLNSEFARITYTEAVDILKKSGQPFEFPVEYGTDLQSEHERFLAETYCKKPVFLTDYPKGIKPFYMRMNADGKTVAAVDLLVPGIGELIGGSQREERLDVLEGRMKQMNLPLENYWWYLDSRKYGSVPHSGFGMGFERFLMMITGIGNIRDVIPFSQNPRQYRFLNGGTLFHFEAAAAILKAMQEERKDILVSLDLNLTEKLWPIEKDRLILAPDVFIDRKTLEAAASRRNTIFRFQDNALIPLEIRSHAYYKLSPTRTAPILEIDGIKMHRSKEMDPLTDAKEKTRMVVSKGDTVLDTCGGLGYSALFALEAGAKKVISTEKSSEVIRLRNLNPWLKKWDGDALEFVHADIIQYIDGLESHVFDSVIHDPPRFTSRTGDLYGKKFYDGLFRVMAPRSKLFHYTGMPKKIKTNDRFIVNTAKRLKASGFTAIEFKDDLQGLYAKKD